jgi:hypothetical protein
MEKFSKYSEPSNNIGLVDVDKIKSGEYEIDSIIDVFTDPDKLEDKLKESGVIGVTTDFVNKEINRGDTIYITAMIRKKGTTSFSSPSVQAVLKLRIIDIYHGLSYLNKVLK